jgi:hypothetical protein
MPSFIQQWATFYLFPVDGKNPLCRTPTVWCNTRGLLRSGVTHVVWEICLSWAQDQIFWTWWIWTEMCQSFIPTKQQRDIDVRYNSSSAHVGRWQRILKQVCSIGYARILKNKAKQGVEAGAWQRGPLFKLRQRRRLTMVVLRRRGTTKWQLQQA